MKLMEEELSRDSGTWKLFHGAGLLERPGEFRWGGLESLPLFEGLRSLLT